jgi:hypothetical protein
MKDHNDYLDDDGFEVAQAPKTFTMVPNAFLQYWAKEVGLTATMVYLQLRFCADNKTHVCWPSVKFISRRTNICESSVRKALATLRETGLIEVTRRERNDGTQTSNLYYLPDPPVPQSETGESPETHPVPTERGGTHEIQAPLRPDTGLELDSINYTHGTRLSNVKSSSSSIDQGVSPDTGGAAEPTTTFQRASNPLLKADATIPRYPEPMPQTRQEEDEQAGRLFQLVEDAGQLIWSHMHAQEWLALLDITRDMTLIEEAFRSVARMGKTPSPRYIQVILERCIQEGRRPGEGKPSGGGTPTFQIVV